MASPSKLVGGRFLAISHKFRTRNQKNEPPVKMYDSTFKHTILSQLPDSEKKSSVIHYPLEGSGSGAWRGPKE
jgi:hypothetical protein